MRDVFASVDADGSGCVTRAELAQATEQIERDPARCMLAADRGGVALPFVRRRPAALSSDP